MRVLVDANFLIYLLDRRKGGGQTDEDRRAKLHDVIAQVEKSRGAILIPTPALTEYLTNARDAGPQVVAGLKAHQRIRVVPFDDVAAQEAALMHRSAWDAGGHKRAPLPTSADWQRIKVDWQIAAIAKVHGARVVTNDKPLAALVRSAGLVVNLLDEMPIPDGARQLLIEGVERAPAPALPVAAKAAPQRPAG